MTSNSSRSHHKTNPLQNCQLVDPAHAGQEGLGKFIETADILYVAETFGSPSITDGMTDEIALADY